MLFAHSLPSPHAQSDWEPLPDHLQAVGHRAGGFADAFGATAIARAAGVLHDIGKVSTEYQAYIRGAVGRGPDHSTAGARAALTEYGAVGQLLAFAIAGHHGGLPNGTQRGGGGGTLVDRLGPDYPIPHHDGWRDATGALPEVAEVEAGVPTAANLHCPNFQLAFAARMIFSCLVDADWLETERFYAEAEGGVAPARGGTLADRHLAAIRAHMARHRRDDSDVNRLRSRVLDHAVAKAALPTGLFTLTVPTGGGKTLTSLQFALEHAHRHGLRRIVYVIPFTSIIEQTAAVFRTALGTNDDILEHHSSFDWDEARPDAQGDREQEGRQGLAKLRRDAENWDAPIVVTTAVQFFESLFTAKRGRARKLHNLAKSVIVLDEAQTMPVHLLRPCMAALDELTRYGASVVLCTATQPALRQCDGALPDGIGFALDDERELAPDVRGLFKALHRVDVEWRWEPVPDETIVARFAERPQMLTIVNSRAHAAKLFAAIADQPGARHLTTLMCARHRREVLAEVRADLKEGRPVRLVATSLIEAGVDVDFPEVWRAAAGLDSIAQAAGRCNREGRLPVGRTVVFEPAEAGVPRAMRLFWEAARPVLRGGDDPLGVDAVRAYFRELYFRKGAEALDAATLRGEPFPILPAIEHGVRPHDDFKFAFPFADIGEAFRLIDQVMDPVLVPYNEEAVAALKALRSADRPPVAVLRKLQQFTVPVPSKVRAAMLATGAAQAIRPEDYGDRFIALESLALYHERTGLRLDDPTSRSAESNIVS